VPPTEWIQGQLTRLIDIIERSAERSALILRKLVGQLRLQPTRGNIGRPYYVAKTSLNKLALPEERLETAIRWKVVRIFCVHGGAGIEPQPSSKLLSSLGRHGWATSPSRPGRSPIIRAQHVHFRLQEMARLTSVWTKSLPLNNIGSPVTFDGA
jgi:hypothetical protein